MLKRLALFATAIFIVSFFVYGQTYQAKQARQRDKGSLLAVDSPAQQNNGTDLKIKNQQHVDADVKVVSLPPKDWQDKAGFWISLTLALVGFGGVVVGVCTLSFLRSQVVEMRRQADLMKTQADHMEAQTKELAQQGRNMLAAERAWIVETITFFDEIPRRSPTGGGIIAAKITFKNIGKQPAILRILQLRFHAAEKLSDRPEFRVNQPFSDGYMLPPGEELYVRALLEQGSFDDEQIARINGEYGYSSLDLYIYGNLVYESVGVRGRNLFCYKWRNLMGLTLEGDKARFEKNGPLGYNSHT